MGKLWARHAALAWLLLAACTSRGDGGCASRSETRPIHALRLPGLDGSRFYMAEHRGQIVVMVFWSVHCVPCHRQLMELSNHPLARSESVELVSVCVDPEDRALVEQGVKMVKGKIGVFLDNDRQLASSLGVEAEPTTVLFDQTGTQSARIVGYNATTLSRIERHVALLEERRGL